VIDGAVDLFDVERLETGVFSFLVKLLEPFFVIFFENQSANFPNVILIVILVFEVKQRFQHLSRISILIVLLLIQNDIIQKTLEVPLIRLRQQSRHLHHMCRDAHNLNIRHLLFQLILYRPFIHQPILRLHINFFILFIHVDLFIIFFN